MSSTPPSASRALTRRVPLTVVGILLVSLTYGAFYSIGSVYALKIGLERSQIAWFMAAAIVGSTLMQWPIGMLSDRMDRRRVAVGLSAVVSVIAVVLAVLPGHAALPIYALMFLYGGLSFPLYGVFLSLAADRMRGDEFVAASSNVLLLNGAGSAIGPVLVAWLMEAVDARAYLLFVAAIHVIVCALVGMQPAANRWRQGGAGQASRERPGAGFGGRGRDGRARGGRAVTRDLSEASMSETIKPLAGLRVLELGQLLAGPFAAALLAYFGAEVIKVEPPEGDPIRGWRQLDEGGTSYWWRSLGRNKKCITVDLKSARGQDVVRRLAERSDVLIENFSPGVLERWGLAPEALKAVNPRLVIARISGYGQDGPYAAKPGFASVCEGISGFRYLNGFPGEAPVRPNLSIGDTIAALHAALGILIALRARDALARWRRDRWWTSRCTNRCST